MVNTTSSQIKRKKKLKEKVKTRMQRAQKLLLEKKTQHCLFMMWWRADTGSPALTQDRTARAFPICTSRYKSTGLISMFMSMFAVCPSAN